MSEYAKLVDAGEWVTAKEAKRPSIRHIRGHKRLGLSHTRCGKTVGTVRINSIMGDCELCVAAVTEERTRVREDDILRQNFLNMRNAKIAAEEALIVNGGEMLDLRHQIQQLESRERGRLELEVELNITKGRLQQAEAHPFRFWLKRKLEVA